MASSSDKSVKNPDSVLPDEAQDIVGIRLPWMVRKGNSFLILLTGAILAFTWFIKYPDTIQTRAVIRSREAPLTLMAKSSGKKLSIHVTNEAMVQHGQLLANIENTCSVPEVLLLKEWIDSISKHINTPTINIQMPPPCISLGELQPSFQQLLSQWNLYTQTLPGGRFQLKLQSIYNDLERLRSIQKINGEQHLLRQADKALKQKEFTAYETLAREKVIAPLELDRYKSELLQKQQQEEQQNIQQLNTDLSLLGKQKELNDLKAEIQVQQEQFISEFLELKAELEKWTDENFLIAPVSGKLFYHSSVRVGQPVTAGQTIFIIEQASTNFYAEINASQIGFGKMKQGQKVILKPDGYPANEFGVLEGRISYLGPLPDRGDSLHIKVELLPNKLLTIPLQNGITANADIITNEKRLLLRLTGQLQQLFK